MKFNSRSISVRLTLGLGMISLIVFATAGALLHRAMTRDLIETDHRELRGKLGVVHHYIDEFAGNRDAQTLYHRFDDLSIGNSHLSIRVVASDASDLSPGTTSST